MLREEGGGVGWKRGKEEARNGNGENSRARGAKCTWRDSGKGTNMKKVKESETPRNGEGAGARPMFIQYMHMYL